MNREELEQALAQVRACRPLIERLSADTYGAGVDPFLGEPAEDAAKALEELETTLVIYLEHES